MRPEDIKVGTVFADEYGVYIVVIRIYNNIAYFRPICPEVALRQNSYTLNSDYFVKSELLYMPSHNIHQSNGDLILPPYYATDTPYEPFKIGDFYNMNIREFSALKYLLRSKDENKRVEDLKKAITCIHKEIIRLESLKESGN